jgi:starvation-inducible DNA-binding protein
MEKKMPMNPTTVSTAKTTKPLKEAQNKQHIEQLKIFLTDTFVLYMKTLGLHWNVQGPKFYEVHKISEDQYVALSDRIDILAERLRALGAMAPLSLKEILQLSSMTEYNKMPVEDDAVEVIVESNRRLSNQAVDLADLCDKNEDGYTADLVKEMAGVCDKFAWMFESLLKRPSH